MILPLFLIPISTLLVINYFNFAFKANSKFLNIKLFGSNLVQVVKLLSLTSLFINLAYSIILWKEFPIVVNEGILGYPGNSWFELHHSLNLPFVILSTLVLIVALLTAWYSSVNIQSFLNLLLILEICLVGAFACTNLFVFLLFFEASAIPIALWISYYGGSNRRERIKASYYFLFFTLYGSISLLLVIISVFNLETNGLVDSYGYWLLLFIAFAVKIPLFPFHIWLPHAHVEASTSVSIILAALMLKLGGYGVLNFMLPMFSTSIHLFFRPLAVITCISGVIYGGLVAMRQLDLKRQIAFSSISHMSFAVLGIFSLTSVGMKGAMYLMLSHGLTSAGLFYLIGVLSDRFHTRSVLAYSGLFGVMPNFAFFLIFVSLANVGFPGTSGFLPELFVLVALVQSMAGWVGLTLVGMLLGTASSLIMLLRLLFGHPKLFFSKGGFSDMTRLENTVIGVLCFWMLILGLTDVLIIST